MSIQVLKHSATLKRGIYIFLLHFGRNKDLNMSNKSDLLNILYILF